MTNPIMLYGLLSEVEWQCAHTVYQDMLATGQQRGTYEFEGPDGDTVVLIATRKGKRLTITNWS